MRVAWPLGIAFLCALLFLVALHPASGAVGGIVHLLAGWALPSVSVAALSLALAALLPVGWVSRICVAFALAPVIGLNTTLKDVGPALSARPTLAMAVARITALPQDRFTHAVRVKRRSWGAVSVTPFGPRVRVAGDEGCGCFYFLDRADVLYSDRVLATLFEAVGERGAVVDYGAPGVLTREDGDVHIDLQLFERSSGYRAEIVLFDHGTVAATFRHDGIPASARVERPGLGRGHMTEHFWLNAFDLLLHDNIWSWAMSAAWPGYFPTAAWRAFLAQAISR